MSILSVGSEKHIFSQNSKSFEEREKELELIKEQEGEEAQRKKNSPFSRWTQFNNEYTQELIWLALKHPKAHAILLFLVDQMDNYNAVICSYQVLQELLGVSKDTVWKNVKVLKENGFIAILKSGASNVYTINHKIYWKSWGSNLKYSKFPANVVLSLSEQEKVYQANFEEIEVDKLKVVNLKDS